MDAHELRKSQQGQSEICTVQCSGEAYRQNPSMGESYGNPSGQACHGDDREGMKNTEIAQEMRERYLVSAKKTALAITIANRERALLQDIDYEHGYSLYVGIPFCPSICLYCSFSSYPLKLWAKKSR